MMSQRIKCEISGKTVEVTATSPRKLELTPFSRNAEIYEDGKLVGLDFDGEFGITAGEVMPIKKQKYKVKSISRMKADDGSYMGYYLNISDLNKSCIFLFPFLNYSRTYFRWHTDFMNCFSSTEDNPDEDALYLWYKYTASIEMEEFEAKIKKHPQYLETIDVDQYHVLYKFSIPTRYYVDYKLIIQGKYSRISSRAKERILDFHSATEKTPLGKILTRNPKRRAKMEKELEITIPEDAELHDPFYIEEERYLNEYRIPAPKLSKW